MKIYRVNIFCAEVAASRAELQTDVKAATIPVAAYRALRNWRALGCIKGRRIASVRLTITRLG